MALPYVYNWPPETATERLPSGVYWVEFSAEGATVTRKLTYLR